MWRRALERTEQVTGALTSFGTVAVLALVGIGTLFALVVFLVSGEGSWWDNFLIVAAVVCLVGAIRDAASRS